MAQFIGIIPARFSSTRFPGKPLVDIKGKSMIKRVYEQVLKAGLNNVYVATDDDKIFQHVIAFGGNCLMTSDTHQSGTDRCSECAQQLQLDKQDVLINIQGDEPFIEATQITNLCKLFDDENTQIATLIKRIDKIEDLEKIFLPYDLPALGLKTETDKFLAFFEEFRSFFGLEKGSLLTKTLEDLEVDIQCGLVISM
jgi:3-deoxy-manno-octulosonate cytidylyltransferase (CMP-KDO synthetase)